MVRRWLEFVSGLAIIALGVAFSIKADLGTSPITSLPYAASEIWPVSVGTATIVMHFALVAIQIAILRKDFELRQLLQVPIGMLFGFMIDGSMWVLNGLCVVSYAAKSLYCAIGIILVGIGVWLEVKPRLLYLAGEGVVVALTKTCSIKLGYLKVLFDVGLVAVAVLTALCGLGRIVGVREGTLAAMILVGLIVRVLNKFLLEKR